MHRRANNNLPGRNPQGIVGTGLALAAVLALLLVVALPQLDRTRDETVPELEIQPVGSATLTRIEAIAERITQDGLRWRAGVTGISNLSPEEFQALLGARPPADEPQVMGSPTPLGTSADDLPAQWDWRELGGVTGVRSQGRCGSCWAFSAAAAVEALSLIYEDRELDLSEQHAMDCNYDHYGCDGGWMTSAYRLWRLKGALSEAQVPYTGENDRPCTSGALEPVSFVTTWTSIQGSREALKRALTIAPLAVGIHIYPDFQHYRGGIYEHAGSDPINHAVLLVGWDDEDGVWILKNSWGTGWGERGFARVAYDCCRLGSYAHLVRIPAAVPLRIHHASIGDTLADGEPLAVTAYVSSLVAPLDPASVRLYLDLGDGFEAVSMERLGGDAQQGSYRTRLPALPCGARFRYYIEARDQEGRRLTLPAAGERGPFEARILRTLELAALASGDGWESALPSDDATAGIWEWGLPEATQNASGTIQPGESHTGTGEACFVTGLAAGEDASRNDVDGGVTRLASPRLPLGNLDDAILRFWVWFSNHRGPAPWEDAFRAEASSDDGATWITLYETSRGFAEWRRVSVRLDSLLELTGTFRLRFVVADSLDDSLVEAAIGDIEILTATDASSPVDDEPGGEEPDPEIPEIRERLTLRSGPNPAVAEAELTLALPRTYEVCAQLFDSSGRLVRTLWSGPLPPGVNRLHWNGRCDDGQPAAAGRYWARISAEGHILRRSLTLLR